MVCRWCGKTRRYWPKDRKDNFSFRECSDKCHSNWRRKRKEELQSAHKDRMPDQELRKIVMKRDHWTCRYCGDKAEEIDHVIPFSKGGLTRIDNLVASCYRCNRKVRDRVFDSFEAKQAWLLARIAIPPFHQPRQIKHPKWHASVYGGMKSIR